MATIVIASCFEEKNIRRVREAGSDRVLYNASLVPPPRWPGDIVGEHGWKRTPEQQETFLEMISEAEILLDFPRNIERPLPEAAPGLRWVQGGMAGAGPVARDAGLLETDIVVTTASGVFSTQLAEFVLGGMIHAAKRFDRLREHRLRREWREEETGTLEGKTLCIIGTGSIGQAIADLARPFGLNIIGVKRTVKPGDSIPNFDVLYRTGDLHKALKNADYVSITLPATPETERLVDDVAFGAMKPGVHLSNVGRGVVVDEGALVRNLRSGHVSGAALDVFAVEPLPENSPLWGFENVILSPHSTDNVARVTETKFIDLFLENLRRYRAGEALENVLNRELLY
ncbi:D-2-hydroxyacid dehydrogenase [Rubrobacter indicoceani]|uniref:D-2-hydroxyacid dehydrogenase n=1 Tax=Rubrobacter indicoceani TaxID=2051957 RepID=UPI0013C4806C|nr:D-2-hydroxyacid dehydrogenase [Rubrobacter indicoceani]